MRLALAEGRLTRWRELLDELTPTDLAVLRAYQSIEPWGDRRADLREAVMASILSRAINGDELNPNELADYLERGDAGGRPGARAAPAERPGDGHFVSPNAIAASMTQTYGRA